MEKRTKRLMLLTGIMAAIVLCVLLGGKGIVGQIGAVAGLILIIIMAGIGYWLRHNDPETKKRLKKLEKQNKEQGKILHHVQ